MLKRVSKFKMSQNAHSKLANYHSKKYKETGDGIHWIKSGYHNSVHA